jgi:NAD-dependent deacetylase
MTDSIQTIQKWLKSSSYTVVFTGAGMSTESGLPDFRSSISGLWKNQNPMKLASTEAMNHNRAEFIEFYQQRMKSQLLHSPHIGHEILVKWERAGKLQSIITQNVDGFHHLAGSQNISELHGTLRTCYCGNCRSVFRNERFLEKDLSCECGGFIRPSVILFGEMLPEKALIQANLETKKAELFIVLGSTLSVSPANYFPLEAKENGAKLVIVNMEPTKMDPLADLVVHQRKIGEVLQEIDLDIS